MANIALSTPKAPAALGPYSQGIDAGETVYVSGQLGLVPETGEFAEGGTAAQVRQGLENVRAILAEAGLTMADVVDVTVLLADIADFAAANEVYAEFFSEPYPARACYQVVLPKGGLSEIKVVARRSGK